LLLAAREEGFPLENIFILEGQISKNIDTGPTKHLESMIQAVKMNKIPREDIRAAGKDTLAYLVFSSGTSGLPKGMSGSLYLITNPTSM